ncbi:hypothetical protein [Salimicrobium flavidum]|uniref:Uncharacterized protein n=1 Tax=Salimicrobium flavidum TaxID=570947 RepID=A0A1N7JXG0_9BACI|nr:hypothetical protein [Salimicrobium flavidum]SIS54018.1 hypothetical protein SAMN05421687_10825 [Salimicrobium flavidum]
MNVKCIETHRTYYAGTFTRREIYATPRDGKPRKLITSEPTLRITSEGFTLETAEGEVIGRGKEKQPRRIVENLARRGLKVRPTIDINTEQERIRTSYQRFISEYGGGEYGMETRRYFKCYVEQAEADEQGEREYTAIGVQEYERRSTVAIGSFYAPNGYTNRQAYEEIARYIHGQLNDGEHAVIKYAGNLPAPRARLFKDRLTFRHEPKRKPSMDEVRTLAEDAVSRQASIEQRFTEPLPSGVNDE